MMHHDTITGTSPNKTVLIKNNQMSDYIMGNSEILTKVARILVNDSFGIDLGKKLSLCTPKIYAK